mgnify:FL=1
MIDEPSKEHVYVFMKTRRKFCGPKTKCIACIFLLFCFPIAPCVAFCPCDEREETNLRSMGSLDKEVDV